MWPMFFLMKHFAKCGGNGLDGIVKNNKNSYYLAKEAEIGHYTFIAVLLILSYLKLIII